MDIVSALFVESFNMRPAPGPSTRIDITGAFFSMAAPAPVPVTLEPHLLVLVRCAPDEPGEGILEVVFKRGDDQVARNVSPFTVEPGKFTYRLVRARSSSSPSTARSTRTAGSARARPRSCP